MKMVPPPPWYGISSLYIAEQFSEYKIKTYVVVIDVS